MAKVYISAGHSSTDPGAVGHVVERDEVWKIADDLAAWLEDHGITAYRDQWAFNWRQTVDDANEKEVDYFFEIHENAGGGNGAECIIHNKGNQYIADALCGAFKSIGQQWRRTIIDPEFWVLKYTTMPAVIIEVAFVDNWDDIKDFDSDDEKKVLAAALGKAIATLCGVETTPQSAPEDKPTGEIQVGSMVRIRTGAQWYGGAEIPDWVMAKSWPVSDISGDRVVLDKGGICSPIHLADIVPESGTAPAPAPDSAPAEPQIEVDGRWGRNTTMAVQRKLGMAVQDGVLSNQYQGNLDACIRRDSINANGWDFTTHVSSVGSDTVRALQRMVGVAADGVLGPQAITALQIWLGVTADGVLGPDTVRALQRWCNQ